MKCPDCGTELGRENTCSYCGKQTKDTDKDIEVEYKEFSLSEFLEIRHKQHKNQEDVSKKSPEQDRVVLSTDKTGKKKRRKPHKKSFSFFIISLIVITVIAVFFLLTFRFTK